MSISVNRVTLIGRVGRDPEVRYTSSGSAVANFTVATDESYKDRSGEKQKKTEWHNIVVWGPSVEAFVQPYVKKGSLVYIEGKLQTRAWEDKKNGGTRYTTEIVVSDIKMESNGNSQQNGQASRPAARPAPQPAAQPAQTKNITGNQDITDDEIPF